MPRGNAMNLIPWPYRWLAIAALAVALIGFGWIKGAGHVQAQWDAAAQQQTLQTAAVRLRQAEATVKVVTQYVDRVRVVREKGDTITPPKALARALTDVQLFEGALKQCVTVPLAQHEYDALVSFSYNVGSRAFCPSTLVRKLNTEDYAGACAELLRWRFFQGKDCALPANARLCGGLATRRQAEYRQCIGDAS